MIWATSSRPLQYRHLRAGSPRRDGRVVPSSRLCACGAPEASLPCPDFQTGRGKPCGGRSHIASPLKSRSWRSLTASRRLPSGRASANLSKSAPATPKRRLLSIVVPLLNEEATLEQLYGELEAALASTGPRVGGRVRRRRLDGRVLSRARAAPRRAPQRSRRAPAPELRQGCRARGGNRRRRRRRDRHDGRGSAGRPGRDPEPPGEARRRLRRRLGLEVRPARSVRQALRLSDLQHRDAAGDRGQAARHELRPEGVPRRGVRARAALRRAPSLRSGARAPPRLQRRRAARQSPAADERALAVRDRALPPQRRSTS